MMVSVEGPGELQGEVLKTLMQRRGIIVGTTEDEGFVRVDANVPLAEVQEYAPDLRSMTGGRGMFAMEFSHYDEVPAQMVEKIIENLKQD